MIRGPAVIVLLGLLTWAPVVSAEDEADDAATVRALLQQMLDGPYGEAYEKLMALGEARVLPHLRLSELPTPALRCAAFDILGEMGSGEALYRIALEGMRDPVQDTRMMAIEILSGAICAGRAPFQQAWWRDLLLAFHGTKVVKLEGFYSGPGFPSWNLEENILSPQVHGSEATLMRLTKDRNWRVRMMAAGFLGCTRRVRTDDIEQALVTRLADEHPTVRRMAVRVLCDADWTGALVAVGARLDDPEEDEGVRVDAATRLPFLDPERARPYLLRAMVSPFPKIREAAASFADVLVWTDEVAVALIAAMWDEVPQVRHEAASAIVCVVPWGKVPPLASADEQALVRALEDDDPMVGAAAAEVLASQGLVPAEAVPRLIEWLGSEGHRPLWAAIHALESLRAGAASAVPALRAVPGGHYAEEGVKRAIEAIEMAALSNESLDRRLADPDLEVRLAAMREVLRRGDRIRVLRGLKDRDAEVVVRAAEGVVDDPAYTKVCVEAAIRAVGIGVTSRPAWLLRELGDRILPHAPLLIDAFRADPSAHFDTLSSVEQLRPALTKAIWENLVGTSHVAPAKRAALVLESLLPEVRAALRDGPTPLRERVLDVLELARAERVWPLIDDLEAVRAAHPEDATLRDRIRLVVEEKAPGPHWAGIELR